MVKYLLLSILMLSSSFCHAGNLPNSICGIRLGDKISNILVLDKDDPYTRCAKQDAYFHYKINSNCIDNFFGYEVSSLIFDSIANGARAGLDSGGDLVDSINFDIKEADVNKVLVKLNAIFGKKGILKKNFDKKNKSLYYYYKSNAETITLVSFGNKEIKPFVNVTISRNNAPDCI